MYLMAGCSKGQSRVFLEEDQRVFTLAKSYGSKKAEGREKQPTIKDSGYYLVQPIRLTKDAEGHVILVIVPVKKLGTKKLDALRGINNQIVHLNWSYDWLMNFLGCLAVHSIDVPVVPYEVYAEKVNNRYPTLIEQVKRELAKSEEERAEDKKAREDLPKFNPEAELPEIQEYVWKHCLYQGWFGMQTGSVMKSSEEAKKIWLRCYNRVQKGLPIEHKLYVWAHAILEDIFNYAKFFCREKIHEDWWDLIFALGMVGTTGGMFGLECEAKYGKVEPNECRYMVMDWPASGHVLHNPTIRQLEVECMYCAGGTFKPTLDWCLNHMDWCTNADIYIAHPNQDKIAYAKFRYRVDFKFLSYIPPEDLKSGAYKFGPKKKKKKEPKPDSVKQKAEQKAQEQKGSEEQKSE